MLEASIVLEHEDLKFTLNGSRNEASGRYTETITVQICGEVIQTFSMEDLNLENVETPNKLLSGIKRSFSAIPKELNKKYLEQYRIFIMDFKTSYPALRPGFKYTKFKNYANSLLFKYEQHPNIKLKGDGVDIILYEPSSGEDRLSIQIRVGDRRNYTAKVKIEIRHDATIIRKAQYKREDGIITDPDVILRLSHDSINRFEDGFKPSRYRVSSMRSGVDSRYLAMKDVIEEILERLNKGWSI